MEGAMNLSSVNIDLFLLVFMRITGLIILNPVFGRNSIPSILKVALSLLCAFIITPTLGLINVNINSMTQMIVSCALELCVGLAIGVIINLLFAVVTMAGEIIDMQMGLGMAFMYDSGAGINMPVIGSFFNAMLIMVFFSSNAHLALFSLISDSFKAIAPGTAFPTTESAKFIFTMGGDFFSLGLRMAIPIMVIELISIITMGMLMKAVPQINIFTVGIQIQAALGILLMLISIPVLVTLCQRLTTFMIEKSSELIRLMMH